MLNLDFSKYDSVVAPELELAATTTGQPAAEAKTGEVDASKTTTEVAAVDSNGSAEVQAEDKPKEGEEATKEEVKVEAEKPKKPSTDAFVELARRERAIVAKERAFKDREAKYSQYEQDQKELETDPVSYFEKRTGKNFQDLVYLHLDKIGNPVEDETHKYKKLEDRIANWEKQKQEEEKKIAESQQSQVWNQHIQAVSKFVNDNSEQYQSINSYPTRALSVYTDILNQARNLAGRELDHEEVVDVLNRTEDILTDELKPLFERLGNKPKFKLSVATPENKKAEEKKQTVTTPTLTNDLVTSSPKVITPSGSKTIADKIKAIGEKYDKQRVS